MEKYFKYLEELRSSGEINMFGAIPYLQRDFPELACDYTRAKNILGAWMRSYEKAGRGETD